MPYDPHMVYQCIRISRWDAIAALIYNYFDGVDADDQERIELGRRLTEEPAHSLGSELEWHINLPPGIRVVIREHEAEVTRFDTDTAHRGQCACFLCGQEFDKLHTSDKDILDHVADEHDDFLLENEPAYREKDVMIPLEWVSYEDWQFISVVDDFDNNTGITKHYVAVGELPEGPICPVSRT